MPHVLGLELVVNARLRTLGEPGLVPIVLEAKAVAVAGRSVGEPEGVIWRGSAAVGGPIETGRVPRVAPGCELGERHAEEEFVGDSIDALALDQGSLTGRHGQSGHRDWDDAQEKGTDLHFGLATTV